MTPVQGQDGDDSVVRGGRSDGVSWIPLSSALQKAQSTLWSPSQNYTMVLFVSEQGCEVGEGGVKSLGLELSSSLSLNIGLGGDDTASEDPSLSKLFQDGRGQDQGGEAKILTSVSFMKK